MHISTISTARTAILTDDEFKGKDKDLSEYVLRRRRGELLNLDRVLMHAPRVAQVSVVHSYSCPV